MFQTKFQLAFLSRLQLLSLVLFSLLAGTTQALEIIDPWTPEAPPGRMMAGFMTIHNPGSEPVVLVEAKSPQFGRVEIHTMTMDDEVMRMRRLDKLTIEPGQSIDLAPGGIHLMLMQPVAPVSQGDQIEIVLISDSQQQFSLKSTVRPRHR